MWTHAVDPQPIAEGKSGGTPWTVLGDMLTEAYDVPVSFASVAWDKTRVGQWVPGAAGPDEATLYERLKAALQALGPNGARAVLWHQGESEASGKRSAGRA